MKIIKKFYKPFVITYVLLSIALGSYPTFDFYTFKGQLIILGVSILNGVFELAFNHLLGHSVPGKVKFDVKNRTPKFSINETAA